MALAKEHERKLRHMLGAEHHYRKNQWGFRNHYAAGTNSTAHHELNEMAALGLVKQGRTTENMVFFHATEAGCKAIGLTKAQIARAFED